MKVKSQSFLPGFNFRNIARAHGGELAQGKRKTRRPLDPQQALHVVLRSSKARGALSMLKPGREKTIHEFVQKTATRWGVRLYRYANVGNHLHLLIKIPSRTIWQRFSRELAGGIPIIVTGAKKGAPVHSSDRSRGFWDHLVFTRIVGFGRDFENLCRYLIKNLFEAMGIPVKKLMAQGLRIMMTPADP